MQKLACINISSCPKVSHTLVCTGLQPKWKRRVPVSTQEAQATSNTVSKQGSYIAFLHCYFKTGIHGHFRFFSFIIEASHSSVRIPSTSPCACIRHVRDTLELVYASVICAVINTLSASPFLVS